MYTKIRASWPKLEPCKIRLSSLDLRCSLPHLVGLEQSLGVLKGITVRSRPVRCVGVGAWAKRVVVCSVQAVRRWRGGDGNRGSTLLLVAP